MEPERKGSRNYLGGPGRPQEPWEEYIDQMPNAEGPQHEPGGNQTAEFGEGEGEKPRSESSRTGPAGKAADARRPPDTDT